MHIAIEKPQIKPDPKIAHEMKLDKHQSEQSLKKLGSVVARSVQYKAGGDEQASSYKMQPGSKIHEESERSSPQGQREIAMDENNNQNVINAADQKSMQDLMKQYGVTGSIGQSHNVSQQ